MHSAAPTFTAPGVAGDATLTFQLAVSDGTNTSYDTVTIQVHDLGSGPQVDAGPAQQVPENTQVTLQGSATSPGGSGLTYTWVQVSGPQVELSDAHSATPNFHAPDLVADAQLVFQLSVSDGTSTVSDTVSVLVNANNDAPSADAGADQQVEAGTRVTVRGGGTDPEGANLSYTWQQVGGPQVAITDPASANLMFSAPGVGQATELSFELTVSDGANTSTDIVRVVVVPAAGGNTPGEDEPATRTPAAHPADAAEIGEEALAHIDSRDLAVLSTEIHGVSMAVDEHSATLHDLDAPAPALPSENAGEPAALDPRTLQVERLVRQESEPAPALPSERTLQHVQQSGESFEQRFERVTPVASSIGGRASLAQAHGAAADSGQEPDPEQSSGGLLAGLFGLLRSAAGSFGWPEPEKPAEPPPAENREERKS